LTSHYLPYTVSVIVEQDDVFEAGDGGAIVDSMESLFDVALVSLFISLSLSLLKREHENMRRCRVVISMLSTVSAL
jgi:hypothetical protein